MKLISTVEKGVLIVWSILQYVNIGRILQISLLIGGVFKLQLAVAESRVLAEAMEALEDVANKVSLQGTYISECKPSKLIGLKIKIAHRFILNGYTREVLIFTDKECGEKGASILFNGTFESRKKEQQTYYVDSRIESVQLNLESKKMASGLNDREFGGKRDWKSGNYYDLKKENGIKLALIDPLPRTEFMLVKINGGSIQMGASQVSYPNKAKKRMRRIDPLSKFEQELPESIPDLERNQTPTQ